MPPERSWISSKMTAEPIFQEATINSRDLRRLRMHYQVLSTTVRLVIPSLRHARRVFGIGFVLLVACVAKGPIYTEAARPEPGRSVVYLYRMPSQGAAASAIEVYLDGKVVASLHNNGFTWFYVDPGPHSVGIAWEPASKLFDQSQLEMQIDSRRDDTLFVRLSYENAVIRMEAVDEDLADEEMSAYRYEPAYD